MPQDKSILLVTLNLKGPSTRYAQLYELLKAHDGWAHYLGTAWLVLTTKTPEELGHEILPLVNKDQGDGFLVVRLREHWGLAPKKMWEWIDKHSG